MIYLDIVETGS